MNNWRINIGTDDLLKECIEDKKIKAADVENINNWNHKTLKMKTAKSNYLTKVMPGDYFYLKQGFYIVGRCEICGQLNGADNSYPIKSIEFPYKTIYSLVRVPKQKSHRQVWFQNVNNGVHLPEWQSAFTNILGLPNNKYQQIPINIVQDISKQFIELNFKLNKHIYEYKISFNTQYKRIKTGYETEIKAVEWLEQKGYVISKDNDGVHKGGNGFDILVNESTKKELHIEVKKGVPALITKNEISISNDEKWRMLIMLDDGTFKLLKKKDLEFGTNPIIEIYQVKIKKITY